MVKGIARQVIVVRPPNTDLFEQAIFILKDKTAGEDGVTEEQILRQAQQAADHYLRNRAKGGRTLHTGFRPILYTLLGALTASVLWALSVLLF